MKKLYDVEYNPKADYRKHPSIWLITPEDTREYQIFAFREISIIEDKDVYTTDLSNSKDRMGFFEKQTRKSQKETGIKPDEYCKIITLSTCTSQTEKGRFVVHAARVDN